MSAAIGHWFTDKNGLPAFSYTGKLPARAKAGNGIPAAYPDDPFFLLGNYRCKLFAHASGQYQLLTGERAWARLNQGSEPNSGVNFASICHSGKETSLVGIGETAALVSGKEFGVGFARYTYRLSNELECVRRISVMPSLQVNSGISAILLEITLRNHSQKSMSIVYREGLMPNYEMAYQQRQERQERRIRYHAGMSVADNMAQSVFSPESEDPFLFGDEKEAAKYDGYPPRLFLAVDGAALFAGNEQGMGFSLPLTLESYELKKLQVVIGWTWKDDAREMVAELLSLADTESPLDDSGTGGAFGSHWKARITDFADEKDVVLRREMRWHVYCLEAMANYSAYFSETSIPQGTTYDFDSGTPSSARDHMQHALALCHSNPELARSVLRLMMKKTTWHGEIRLAEQGFGMTTHQFFSTSDQQLYFFMLLSEYLRASGDLEFLYEQAGFYPVEQGISGTVVEHVEKCFLFLRDEVDTGLHGLVRLLNSDWNDAVYFYVRELPYPYVYSLAESHLNTAMAIKVIGDLVGQLRRLPDGRRSDALISGMEHYRERLLAALRRELEGRNFLRRFYIGDDMVFGEDNLYLEPQCWLLQIPEIGVESATKVWREVKTRVLDGEKLGARQLEKPEDNPFMSAGCRENGGVWNALNGPLVLGLARVDKGAARDVFRRMTLEHHAREFPDYWVGYWSAPDNLDSSLLPTHGLPDQRGTWHEFPVYCAHAHAWPLYCYFRLKEDKVL